MAGHNGGPINPLGHGGIKIHDWMFEQKSFLEHLKLEGEETNNPDNDLIEQTFNRIGANIIGKRMFEEGEANWPEEFPFHCPVFVLTKEKSKPWERPGGTTFYFVNDNIKKVLEIAKKSAKEKDVRISGGAGTIQQYLIAGLIDEFNLHISPVMIGNGVRLFGNIQKENFSFEISEAVSSPTVTHLFYKVISRYKK